MASVNKIAAVVVVAVVAIAGVSVILATSNNNQKSDGINLVVGTDCANLSVSKDSTYFQYWTCAISQLCLVNWNYGVVEPCLAKSWEYDDNFTTFTFHLRDDVYWSDGVKFTSKDVVNSVEYALYQKSTKYSAVSAADDYTVTIKAYDDPKTDVVEGNANLLCELGSNFNITKPVHIFDKEKMSMDKWKTYNELDNYIGTGPMYFSEYKAESGEYIFLPNEHYFGGTPAVSKLTFKSYSNTDALMMALLNGEVDTVYNYGAMGMNLNYLSQVINDKDLDMFTVETAALGPSLWFNQDTALGANKDIRLAIRYAINYDEIISFLCPGLGEVAHNGVWTPRGSFYKETPVNEYNVQKAGKILDDAGWTIKGSDKYRTNAGGDELVMNIVTSNSIVSCIKAGQFLKEYLEAVGIKATVTVPTQSISNEIKTDNYEIAINTWTAGAMDTHLGFMTAPLYMSQMMGQNIGQYDDVKELVAELSSTAVDKRETIAGKIQDYWAENAPIICTYWYSYIQPHNAHYTGFTTHSTWGIISVDTMMNLKEV